MSGMYGVNRIMNSHAQAQELVLLNRFNVQGVWGFWTLILWDGQTSTWHLYRLHDTKLHIVHAPFDNFG